MLCICTHLLSKERMVNREPRLELMYVRIDQLLCELEKQRCGGDIGSQPLAQRGDRIAC